MGKDLGIEVVAEGVEDNATLRLLRQLGCDRAQGFYIAKPLPRDRIETLLAQGWRAPSRRAGDRDTPSPHVFRRPQLTGPSFSSVRARLVSHQSNCSGQRSKVAPPSSACSACSGQLGSTSASRAIATRSA